MDFSQMLPQLMQMLTGGGTDALAGELAKSGPPSQQQLGGLIAPQTPPIMPPPAVGPGGAVADAVRTDATGQEAPTEMSQVEKMIQGLAGVKAPEMPKVSTPGAVSPRLGGNVNGGLVQALSGLQGAGPSPIDTLGKLIGGR